MHDPGLGTRRLAGLAVDMDLGEVDSPHGSAENGQGRTSREDDAAGEVADHGACEQDMAAGRVQPVPQLGRRVRPAAEPYPLTSPQQGVDLLLAVPRVERLVPEEVATLGGGGASKRSVHVGNSDSGKSTKP